MMVRRIVGRRAMVCGPMVHVHVGHVDVNCLLYGCVSQVDTAGSSRAPAPEQCCCSVAVS